MDLPLSLLEDITNGFSHDQQIGSGGFAVVYKGILGKVTIAVKKLSKTFDNHEKQFHEEVSCLMKAKHKNIVRFLGYCSDTRGKMVAFEGKLVMADVRQRLLCFEYLPRGSLDKYIAGSSYVLQWKESYQIIKEICEGLHYLHVERRIVHLDLKPTNILLDCNMVPKIADFGLSRRFCEKQSQILTAEVKGTLGYMAPEFVNNGQITFKSDTYSLGIIITEILTRQRGYRDVEDVLDIWRNRLQESQREIHLEQVRVCTEIAKECSDYNPANRPAIQDIINRLDETESVGGSIETRGSTLSVAQEEKDPSEQHQWTPKVPGEASDEDCRMEVGTILMKRYEIGRLIAQGDLAKVYYAQNLTSEQDVAIKMIDKDKVSSVELMVRIKREMTLMNLLGHPNVLKLVEVMASKSKLYFVLEYPKGGDLSTKIVTGGLHEDAARKYFRQLISAVEYCHSQGKMASSIIPVELQLMLLLKCLVGEAMLVQRLTYGPAEQFYLCWWLVTFLSKVFLPHATSPCSLPPPSPSLLASPAAPPPLVRPLRSLSPRRVASGRVAGRLFAWPCPWLSLPRLPTSGPTLVAAAPPAFIESGRLTPGPTLIHRRWLQLALARLLLSAAAASSSSFSPHVAVLCRPRL
ncbi:hypothetical protein ZWY2020_014310 [Hordeum vulgare]|nr:hypothetical protein ZWY2020_014310 [Hordeum vulgare]